MILLLVLLFIVLTVLLYFFFAPFYFEINSREDLYRIRFHRFASARIKFEDNSLILETRILFWKKQIDVSGKKREGKPGDKKMRDKAERKKEISFKKIVRVLKSFKINKCYVNLDFGNMQVNGILYPVFYFAACYSGKRMEINFKNENELILEIENSLARMSWAYISS